MTGAGMLLARGSQRVTLSGSYDDTVVANPGPAVASFALESDGDIVTSVDGDEGDWVVPRGAAGSYECRATAVSGTVTSGTIGSWQALTSTRTWTKSRATVGSVTAVIDIEIRKGSGPVLATTQVTLYAEVTT